MQLSEGVEWGAHCAILLAALPTDETLPATKLAEFHDIPAAYLAKCLQALSSAGIVTSSAGRRGGYRLARPAEAITLLDIVMAIEGSQPAFRCAEIRKRGPSRVAPRLYSPICGIAATMREAEQAWREVLGATTIAALISGMKEKSPPRAQALGAQWLNATLEERRSA
jgi:Rrf2 family protein